MAHPITHAESSVKYYGGIAANYLAIHDWFDQTKSHFPDNRHRALRHHTEGIFLAEVIFGHEIDLTCTSCYGSGYLPGDMASPSSRPCYDCKATGKSGKAKTRYVGQQHVLEDFGGKFIPTAADYLEHMDLEPWMNNGISRTSIPSSHHKLENKTPQEQRRSVTLD